MGRSLDALLHYWNGWWIERALKSGHPIFQTDLIFHPQGVSLVYHNFAWISIAMWLMLKFWLSGVSAYNLVSLLNLSLCGFTSFLLAREETKKNPPALLAGLIYQTWPARLSQMASPNLVSTQWIPLFILFLIRTIHHGRKRNGFGAGIFLVLIGYTRWQMLIPAMIVGIIYLLFALPKELTSWRRWAFPILITCVTASFALAPPILLLFGHQDNAQTDLLMAEEETTKQTDALAYITPGQSHSVLKSWTKPAYAHYYANRRGYPVDAYIGISTLILIALGIWRLQRTSLPWISMALILILLALGPILRFNGKLYPDVPMPYRLASRLYLVRLMRIPDRFNIFLALPMAMLAAFGTSSVLNSIQNDRKAKVITSFILGGIILFEYLSVPIHLHPLQRSSFLNNLKSARENFAILNLPIDPTKSKTYMFEQTIHEHPIVQGHTSRSPADQDAYLSSSAWLKVLRRYNEMDPKIGDVSRQLDSLAKNNIRYLILQKNETTPDKIARWQRYLLAEPRFEDEQIAVYATEPLAGQDFTLMQELAPGIGPIRIITSAECITPGGIWEVDVGWGTRLKPSQNLQIRIDLRSKKDVSQTEIFPVSSTWTINEWASNSIVWGYYQVQTKPTIESGNYTATITLVDQESKTEQGPTIVIEQLKIQDDLCTFSTPQRFVRSNVIFGDSLRLLGYRLERVEDKINVTLYWRSEHQMKTDYKIFIHILEPSTPTPIAQQDAMPLQWTYPTTLWGAGESIEDTMSVPLEDIPTGDYSVAVGVYDPKTMNRLPAKDDSRLKPDDRFILTRTIKIESNHVQSK
jgi:hypothetical protein